MAENNDIKGKIIELFKQAKPKRPRKRPSRAKPEIGVKGDQNIVVGRAGRDVNINTRHVSRPRIVPPPGSISPGQARRIQATIRKLVEIQVIGGVYDGDRQRLFAKWHDALKKRFDVGSYREIPAARGEEAIAWLKQVAAINRPKLRRTDNQAWRNEHYTAIWARARQLGMSKGDIYGLVLERLGKQVVSLKQLGEQDLRRLYEIVMAKRRS